MNNKVVNFGEINILKAIPVHGKRSQESLCFFKIGSFIPLRFIQDDTDLSEQTPCFCNAVFSCHSERSEESIMGKVRNRSFTAFHYGMTGKSSYPSSTCSYHCNNRYLPGLKNMPVKKNLRRFLFSMQPEKTLASAKPFQ